MNAPPGIESLPPADRRTLTYGPLWMFSLVAGSDGAVDEREVEEVARVVENSRPEGGRLLEQVLSDLTKDGTRVLAGYTQDGRSSEDGLRRIAAILDLNWPPEQGEAFKLGLLAIGHAVAEASGGFLGLGDRKGRAEREALATAASCLGVRPPPSEGADGVAWPPLGP